MADESPAPFQMIRNQAPIRPDAPFLTAHGQYAGERMFQAARFSLPAIASADMGNAADNISCLLSS